MKSSAFTVKVFGVYAILTGVILLLTPNTLLRLFAFHETQEFWVRVLGALVVVVGYYYWVCGVGNARAFISASVPGRIVFCACLVSLVFLAGAPWSLALFGAVELATALWTFLALRKESPA